MNRIMPNSKQQKKVFNLRQHALFYLRKYRSILGNNKSETLFAIVNIVDQIRANEYCTINIFLCFKSQNARSINRRVLSLRS